MKKYLKKRRITLLCHTRWRKLQWQNKNSIKCACIMRVKGSKYLQKDFSISIHIFVEMISFRRQFWFGGYIEDSWYIHWRLCVCVWVWWEDRDETIKVRNAKNHFSTTIVGSMMSVQNRSIPSISTTTTTQCPFIRCAHCSKILVPRENIFWKFLEINVFIFCSKCVFSVTRNYDHRLEVKNNQLTRVHCILRRRYIFFSVSCVYSVKILNPHCYAPVPGTLCPNSAP